MIHIVRNEKYIVVQGHAGEKDEPKTEEVIQACAAVTAITQTLLFSVLRVESEYDYEPFYQLEKGIFILDTEFVSERSLLLVDAFMLGAEALSGAYPNHISVEKQ